MLRKRHKASTDDEAVAADGSYLRLFQTIQKRKRHKARFAVSAGHTLWPTHNGKNLMAGLTRGSQIGECYR